MDDTKRVRGRDYFAPMVVGQNDAVGTITNTLVFTPAAIGNTRLALYALMFEKWKVNYLKMIFTPSVGTSPNGEFCMFFEADPTDTQPSGVNLCSKGVAAPGSCRGSYGIEHYCTYRPEPKQPDLFTSPGTDSRLVSAGQFIVFEMAGTGASTGYSGTTGSLEIEYDITFYQGLLEGAGTGPGTTYFSTVAVTTTNSTSTLIPPGWTGTPNPVLKQAGNYGNTGALIDPATGTLVLSNVGNYMVVIRIQSASALLAVAETVGFAPVLGGSLTQVTNIQPVCSTTSHAYMGFMIVQVNTAGVGSLNFVSLFTNSASTTSGAVNFQMFLYVTNVPTGFRSLPPSKPDPETSRLDSQMSTILERLKLLEGRQAEESKKLFIEEYDAFEEEEPPPKPVGAPRSVSRDRKS